MQSFGQKFGPVNACQLMCAAACVIVVAWMIVDACVMIAATFMIARPVISSVAPVNPKARLQLTMIFDHAT